MKAKYIVSLSADQRDQLKRMISSGKMDSRIHTRARILLQADQRPGRPSKKDNEIQSALGSAISTIARIRKRFVKDGLDGALYDRKSPQVHQRALDGDQEAKLVVLACSQPPEGHERWSMTLLADKLVSLEIVDSIHPSTVWRTLKKTTRSHG